MHQSVGFADFFLVIIDLFNALDKGNLGNAQTKGLSTGTHPPSPLSCDIPTQYQTIKKRKEKKKHQN